MAEVFIKAGGFVMMIAAGYLFKRAGIFEARDYRTVMKLIMNITLPGAVIASFSSFERDMSLLFVAVMGCGLNIAMMAVGYVLAWRKGPGEKAFNVLNYSGYNIGTFAMPYLQSFLGAMGTIVACIYDAGNAVMCTGITYAAAASITGTKQSGGVRLFLKRLFSSVPFDIYVLMLAFYLLDLHLPAPAYTVAEAFGRGNPFLAMFMIGGTFEFCLESQKLKRIAGALVVRFGLAALFALAIYHCLPYSLEIRQTLAIIVFAPVSSMAVINTVRCGGDEELAGIINSMSILISLIAITSLVGMWRLGIAN